MRILLIDNYDSFTYNLAYILNALNVEFDVFRNDKIEAVQCLTYDGIILSPGPGIPNEAGRVFEIIKTCESKIPILGICLGHQAIAEHLGAKLLNRNKVLHGVQTSIHITEHGSQMFQGVLKSFPAGRYHSWEIENQENLNFKVTAVDADNSIMAFENPDKLLYGFQFHPESIMTPSGPQLINNFIGICKSIPV